MAATPSSTCDPGVYSDMKQVFATLCAFLFFATTAQAEPVDVWLGLTGCERTREPFRLTHMDDGSIRLSGRFTPQTLSASENGNEITLSFAGWRADRAPSREAELSLSATVDRDAGVLVGELQGVGECPLAVAKRVPLPPRAQAPGILAKVEGVRNARDAVTLEECAAYFDWLASGEAVAPGGSGPRVNSALADQARMQAILGTDVYRWRNEDTLNVRKLTACRQKVSRTKDAALSTAMKAAQRNGGVVPQPLQQEPDRQGASQWIVAFQLLHSDTFEDLERLLRVAAVSPEAVLPGGSVDKGPNDAAPQVAESAPRNWIGVVTCTRGDRYLRVKQTGSDIELETGPGLFGGAPSARLRMVGDIVEGQFELDADSWIEQSNSVIGRPQPIALRGEATDGFETLRGEVAGDPECQTFRAHLQPPPPTEFSPEGLLFQADLGFDACVGLSEWLASADEDRIGTFRFNSLLLDEDAIRDRLGKPLALWEDADVDRFRAMTSGCRSLLSSSARIEHADLVRSVSDWSVRPLSSSLSQGGATAWRQSELIRVMSAEAEARRHERVAEARALPPVFDSLGTIDGWAAETKRQEGALRYLRASLKDGHLSEMGEIRAEVASRIAAEELERLASFPVTLEGLLDAERTMNEVAARLEDTGASAAARKLADGFRRFASERGLVVWEAFLDESATAISGMADADYRKFDEIHEMRKTAQALMRFARPQSAPSTRDAYNDWRTSTDATVERMVTASLPGLLDWIDALPLSTSGLAAADELLVRTFPEPVRFAAAEELTEAVGAKHAAYNPANYIRPDVIYGFERGHFGDVGFRGLNNLAYVVTMLRTLGDRCSGSVQIGSDATTEFVLSGSRDAMQRLMRGEVESRSEAERGVLILLNTVLNQPGCKVDVFGNVTNDCTTQGEQTAVNQYLMTSGPAKSDVQLLTRGGCNAPEVAAVGAGASRFIGMRPFSRAIQSPPLPALADYLDA